MFCIKCGLPAVVGNFCRECFLQSESLFDTKNFRMTVCDVCGSYYDGKKIDVGESIKSRIKTENKLSHIKISYKKRGNRIVARIECTGMLKSFKKIETKTVEIIVATKKCDDCTKLSGNYYEAVLQLRGEKAERILNKIEKTGFLRFVKPVNNGYDVRLVNKQDAAKLADMLRQYKIQRTFKLVGEKGGKKVYRSYFSIR